jgi:hypothetical protein
VSYITVEVDASEVLHELPDDELQDELDSRSKRTSISKHDLLEQIFRDFRGRCPSKALADYIYELTGRIL